MWIGLGGAHLSDGRRGHVGPCSSPQRNALTMNGRIGSGGRIPPPLHELERYLDKDAMGEWGRLPQRFTAMFPAWALTFELI